MSESAGRAVTTVMACFKTESSTEQLAQLLDERQEGVASLAADVLGQTSDPNAVLALSRALRSADYALRAAAQKSLLSLGAIGSLNEACSDPNRDVAALAIAALRATKQATVGPLVAAMSHDSSYVRREAIEALRELQDTTAVPYLCACLADTDWDVTCAAASVLADFGDPPVLEPLLSALNSSEGERNWSDLRAIRGAIITVVKRLHPPPTDFVTNILLRIVCRGAGELGRAAESGAKRLRH